MARGAIRRTFWERFGDAYEAKHGRRPSQDAAAKFAGKTQGAAKKWKAGGLPRIELAREIAIKLDVNVDWLLTGREPRKPLSDTEANLIDLFRSLRSDLERGEVIGVIKANLGPGNGPPSLGSKTTEAVRRAI